MMTTTIDPPVEAPPAPTTETTAPAKRVLWLAVNALLVIVFLAVGLGVTGSALGWWRAETVLSGSMRPGINPGDVEILHSEAVAALHLGQIVAFHPPHDTFTVTHRVVALQRTAAGTYITTKGDANDADDPWGRIRILGSRVWVVEAVIPKAGFVTVWARTPMVRLLLALFVVTLVCGMAITRIWRRA